MTFVYVVECGGAVKIGVADNPEQRLKDMAVGNPTPVVLFAAREFDERMVAFEIEKRVHRLLRRHRIRGEWFDIAPDDAWALLKKQRPLRLVNPKARSDSTARWETTWPRNITNILTQPIGD